MNECELKFKIVDKCQNIFLHKKVQDIGAYFEENRLELDYVVDLEQVSEKGKGIMLRIRQIYCHDILQNILITLKIQNKSNYCLNNTEVEYNLEFDNYQEIIKINRILLDALNLQMKFDSFISKDIDIITLLEKEKLLKYTLIYSKQREEYRFGTCKILFDSFADSIGNFIEIEAESEEELKKMIKVLNLKYEDGEKRNYGKILKGGL